MPIQMKITETTGFTADPGKALRSASKAQSRVMTRPAIKRKGLLIQLE
jgi:hypothetical protein